MKHNHLLLSPSLTYQRYLWLRRGFLAITLGSVKLGYIAFAIVAFFLLAGHPGILEIQYGAPLLIMALAGVSGGGWILSESSGRKAQDALASKMWQDGQYD